MTLQQLKYVVESVKSGSMSEASKRLYISQPSLSNVIKDLEKELGFEFFLLVVFAYPLIIGWLLSFLQNTRCSIRDGPP